MTRKLLSRFLRVFAILLILVAAAVLIVSMLLKDLDYYTRLGLQNFEDATGYRLTFSKVSMHIERGGAFRIDDFVLSHPDSGRELLSGKYLYVRIKLSRLLKKQIVIRQLLFEEPQIQVYRNADGIWHSFLSAVLAQDEQESESTFGGYSVSARNIDLNGGILEVRDEKHASTVRLHDCDITLNRKDEGMLHMQLIARHHAEGSQGTVRYTSEFHRSLLKSRGPNKKVPILLTGALEFSNMPMRECLSYLPDRFVVPFDGGLLDASLNFDLRHDRQIVAGGELILKGAQAVVPGLELVSLPETRFAFKAGIDRTALRLGEFSLRLEPDVYVRGSAAIENLDTVKSNLTLNIVTGIVNIREIALRVAASDPERFAWLAEACNRMSEGTVSIPELNLSASLGAEFKPDTINLQAQAHLLPGDTHAINLAMTASGGKTRLDCTITSRLIPASVDALLDGLMGASARSTAVMQQGSITLLSSIHFDDSLRIASDIDATDAAYSLAGIIGKPRGVSNTIRVDYAHGKDSVEVPFVFRLGESLSTRGRLLLADGFAVEGRFAAKDCTLQTFAFPFLPPSLSLNGSVSGAGDFAFPVEKGLRPVSAKLKLDGIAFSQQSAAQPLMQVDAALDFSSGSGPISVSGGHVIAGETRGSFSGALKSVMPLVGTFAAPMDVYDIGDFVDLMLDIVRSAEKSGTAPTAPFDDSPGMFAQMDINVDLTSRQTSYLGWDFGSGRSDFTIKDKRMLWDAVDVECGNGTLQGSVLYDLSNPDHYRLEFVIDRSDVDVTWAIPAFQEKQTITGRLNLKSRFSSNFRTSEQLLGNMEGTFDFEVKDGKIKQMTLLSNILNMLNVAQLLIFRMPEYSAQGMPFDIMSGRFLLKDLQLSTDDLVVKCPSMDFSVAGVFDFNVDELELLVGVQVFRTVAKVLGAIPYFGRKITGKGKTLTFAYFRARGPFDNPSIVPVPMKALDNAILKIFKSVWEVPKDLIGLPLDVIHLFSGQEEDNATAQ